MMDVDTDRQISELQAAVGNISLEGESPNSSRRFDGKKSSSVVKLTGVKQADDGDGTNAQSQPQLSDTVRNKPTCMMGDIHRSLWASQLRLNRMKTTRRQPSKIIQHVLQHTKTDNYAGTHVSKWIESCNSSTTTKVIMKTQGGISKPEKQVKSHLVVTRLKCKHCSESFSYMRDLVNHVSIHEDLQFPCEFCEKKFLYESTLRIHRGIHHYY